MVVFSLTVLAMTFEFAGAVYFLWAGGTPGALGLFCLFHLFAGLLLAVAGPAFLPAGRAGGKWRRMMIFSFIFFIPFFGAPGMFLIMLQYRLAGKKGWRPEFFSIPQLPFAAVEGVSPVKMGEGGAWSRLREESVPRGVKLEALMAAGSAPGHNASHLLRLAAGDLDDEIRLVAFNFFEKREKNINLSINQLLSSLKEASGKPERGIISGKLAFAYWEFVYNDLARSELKDFYLDQALSHALKAEKFSGESHMISILIGRIHLRRGDIEAAEHAIDRAMRLGASPDKVVPFKAEALYLRRDFDALKDLFADHAFLRHKPGIGAVVSFWTGA